jgi:hypothetical protein
MKLSKQLTFTFLILGFSSFSYGQGYSFGYRLDYATAPLDAFKVNGAFPEFNSGHTSAFFFRKFFNKELYLEIAPGAWSSETENSQFTFQYSTVGLGYQGGDAFIFDVGASIGGALFVISTGNQKVGEIQTSATVLRKDSPLYTVQVGGGYNFGEVSLLLNLRYFGFLDNDLSKLNNLAAGFSVAMTFK